MICPQNYVPIMSACERRLLNDLFLFNSRTKFSLSGIDRVVDYFSGIEI